MATLEEKNAKRQFIIVLVVVIAFLIISGFIFIYGIIKNIDTWSQFQPFFTALVGPVSALLGYFFKNYQVQQNTDK